MVKKFLVNYTLLIMGLATLLLFPLLGWLITLFLPSNLNVDFWSMFQMPKHSLFLIFYFLSFGIIFGLIVIWLTELEYFEKSMSKYRNLLDNYKLTIFYVVFLSVCAGLGEEVLFRGVLQPILVNFLLPIQAIIIIAFFFVAIHGYFSVKKMRINIFAILLTAFITLLGWGAFNYSFWLAVAGHFSYDLVLLFYYKNTKS